MLKMHNINEEWIRTGTGEPIAKDPSSVIEQLKKEYNLSDFDCSLVYEYLNLNNHDRAVIRDFLQRVNEPINSLMTTQEIIDQEVDNYRKELEAEAKGEMSSVLQNGKEEKRIV